MRSRVVLLAVSAAVEVAAVAAFSVALLLLAALAPHPWTAPAVAASVGLVCVAASWVLAQVAAAATAGEGRR